MLQGLLCSFHTHNVANGNAESRKANNIYETIRRGYAFIEQTSRKFMRGCWYCRFNSYRCEFILIYGACVCRVRQSTERRQIARSTAFILTMKRLGRSSDLGANIMIYWMAFVFLITFIFWFIIFLT